VLGSPVFATAAVKPVVGAVRGFRETGPLLRMKYRREGGGDPHTGLHVTELEPLWRALRRRRPNLRRLCACPGICASADDVTPVRNTLHVRASRARSVRHVHVPLPCAVRSVQCGPFLLLAAPVCLLIC